MRSDNRHVSDEDLLAYLDGELSRWRRTVVKSHLTACWGCRSRAGEMQSAIGTFVQLHKMADKHVPSAAGPRASLKAKLAALADTPQISWTESVRLAFAAKRWFYITASLLVIVGALVLQFSTLPVGAASTPDADLTPGLVRTTSQHDICLTGELDVPAISSSIALEVFKQYGIRRPQPRAYEVDYLITPALGGAHDVRNLWPQPYSAGIWNAHIKDALEDHLYDLVCQGKIDLVTAQRDISTNWIAAYKKYFRSEHPLPIHVDFQKDPPWE